MPAQIIDGKRIAAEVNADSKSRIAALKTQGITPGLAAVLLGEDPASATYVNSKAKACERLGLYSEVIRLPMTTTQAELMIIVESLNENDRIHGILVQSPLPTQIDELAVTLSIDPRKDVDGFHPYNVGMMFLGRGVLMPCTPCGIVKMLEKSGVETAGKEVVVVGRSNIVGKPVAAMLMQKAPFANATVTVAHSQSKNLKEIILRADIVIAAIGRAEFIKADMVKVGVVLIDVGVNRVEDSKCDKGYRLVGDVDFDDCVQKASFISPVPGGVGPMTIAMLMSNTITAAERIGY